MSPQEATSLIEQDIKNNDVIFPYLNGDDVNSSIGQLATRYVINFQTMSLEEAEKYSACFAIVKARVAPYRATITKQVHETDYWKFWDKRISSYEKIADFDRVLVAARAAKDVQLTWVKNRQVFSDQLVVFLTDCSGAFAVLQSSIHSIWAWERCTGMWGAGIRYAPSKAVSTFPIPFDTSFLFSIGEEYFRYRLNCEQEQKLGLTAIYNQFHDSTISSRWKTRLRELHCELDRKVLTAYGWDDILLEHDFRVLQRGSRFSLSDRNNTEILNRITQLNQRINTTSRQRKGQ